ncbi:hypothetical protein G8B26_07340 [Limosilactobacillus reuteri]|nr:hypothetical protein G8B26_07340 [Limosilactobacillus reuteri]
MAKTKLETELRSGISRFVLRGTAVVDDKTFPREDTVSDSGWKYRRSSFAIKVGDNNYQYVEIMGGRSSENPVIYTMNNDNEPIQVKWDLRTNKTVLENIPNREFIRIAIEKQEGSDKATLKKFLSPVDAIEYLAEHLEDGTPVEIRGDVEYQQYNGRTQQRLNVTQIYLKNPENDDLATMSQMYLVDSNALPRQWKKKIEEDGQIKVNLFVPQYVGKYNGKKIKKTVAMPQQIVIKINEDDENHEKFMSKVEEWFTVKKGVVRKMDIVTKLFFGYESSTGNIEITPEIQDLIDAGIMTLEQVQNEATITENRIEENVFDHPMIHSEDGKILPLFSDTYSPEALVMLEDETDEFDNEEDDQTVDTTVDSEEDDVFSDDDLFS